MAKDSLGYLKDNLDDLEESKRLDSHPSKYTSLMSDPNAGHSSDRKKLSQKPLQGYFHLKSAVTFLISCIFLAKIVAILNKEAITVAVFTKWICRYGCPAIIHTDMGNEFINKISTELYEKLQINGSKNTQAHPQCNLSFQQDTSQIYDNCGGKKQH